MLSTYLIWSFNTCTYFAVFYIIYLHLFNSMKQVKVPQALRHFNWSCFRANLQQCPRGQTARWSIIPHSNYFFFLIGILYCLLFSVLPPLNSNFVVWIIRENNLLCFWSAGFLSNRFLLMAHKCGPFLYCGTLFKIQKL